ncbi:MAG TPA: hypothetical protein VMR28_00295 [Candidatus Saccharimonadales bacterium]|nr:hypothetical protein [Candidatus Saccharimonadales bacterium]
MAIEIDPELDLIKDGTIDPLVEELQYGTAAFNSWQKALELERMARALKSGAARREQEANRSYEYLIPTPWAVGCVPAESQSNGRKQVERVHESAKRAAYNAFIFDVIAEAYSVINVPNSRQ